MLKDFEAVNVQEPENGGASPAGTLGILGPASQQTAWVLVVCPSSRLQASPPALPAFLGSSMD